LLTALERGVVLVNNQSGLTGFCRKNLLICSSSGNEGVVPGFVNSANAVINAPVETKGWLSSLFYRRRSYPVNTSPRPKFHHTL